MLYNRKAKAEGRPLIRKWVALDDRPLTRELGGEKLAGHTVLTMTQKGLTRPKADELIALLRQ